MGYTQTRKNEGTEIARVTRCASGSLEGKAFFFRNLDEFGEHLPNASKVH